MQTLTSIVEAISALKARDETEAATEPSIGCLISAALLRNRGAGCPYRGLRGRLSTHGCSIEQVASHRGLCWKVTGPSFCVLIKLIVGEKPDTRLNAQVSAQTLAGSRAIPVPRILAHGSLEVSEETGCFIVQDWVSGEPANASVAGWSETERESVARQLAGLMSTLHEIRGERFTDSLPGVHSSNWGELYVNRLDRLLGDAIRWETLDIDTLSSVRTALVRRLDSVDLDATDPRLAHRDLHLGNVIVDKGEVRALIDWECAAFYDPLWDFARLRMFLSETWPDLEARVAHYYREIRSWPTDGERRLALYEGAERLGGLHLFSRRYPDAQMAARQREGLLRWLAHEQAS